MRKIITGFASFVFLTPLYASEVVVGEAMPYLALIGIGGTFVFFVLWSLCRSKLKETTSTLAEREEKIAWLRQINAQNEHDKVKFEHEMEKKMLEMQHTIETAEKKLKEGSKNQVIAKIESLQRKRNSALSRAGLTK